MRVHRIHLPTTWFWFGLSVAALVFYAVSVHTRMDQAVAEDETSWLLPADALHQEGFTDQVTATVFSPHLYLHAVRGTYALLGRSAATARLPGALSGLLTLFMVCLLAGRCAGGAVENQVRAGALAVLLCATMPVTVQAAAIADIDNTVLTPAVLVLCWPACELIQDPGWPRAGLTAIALALALWCRVTTPWVICPLFLLFCTTGHSPRRALTLMLGALAAGSVLFLATWAAYCHTTGVRFLGPLQYAVGSFVNRSVGAGGFSPSWFAQSCMYLTLWTGIFALAVFAVVGWTRGRAAMVSRRVCPTDLYLAVGLFLLAGYTVVGGAVFGFPKHHCPGFPLLCVAAGVTLSGAVAAVRPGRIPVAMAAGLLAAVVQWLLCGDLLYEVRFSLRQALAWGEPSPAAVWQRIGMHAALAGIAWSVLYGVFWHRAFRREPILLLLVLAVGANAGLVLRQNVAPYHTGYMYGDTGARAATAHLVAAVPPGYDLIIPNELNYALGRPGDVYTPNPLWDDREELVRRIAAPRTGAIAVSFVGNTVRNVRLLRGDAEIQTLLSRDYQLTEIGPYLVWVRNGLYPDAG